MVRADSKAKMNHSRNNAEYEAKWRDDMKCNNCRFWSDKLAQSIGCGPVEAYCLSSSSPSKGKYTPSHHGCDKGLNNSLGSIDSGSDDDPRYGNPYEEAMSDLYD